MLSASTTHASRAVLSLHKSKPSVGEDDVGDGDVSGRAAFLIARGGQGLDGEGDASLGMLEPDASQFSTGVRPMAGGDIKSTSGMVTENS